MKKRNLWFLFFFVSVAMFLFLALKEQKKEEPPISLKPKDRQTLIAGKKIYDTNCASCHGDRLQGEPNWKSRDSQGYLPAPPHDSSGHTWHHSEQVLFEITKNGFGDFAGKDYKTRMPEYKSILKDEEIIAVLSYIKANWPPEIQKQNNLRSQ